MGAFQDQLYAVLGLRRGAGRTVAKAAANTTTPRASHATFSIRSSGPPARARWGAQAKTQCRVQRCSQSGEAGGAPRGREPFGPHPLLRGVDVLAALHLVDGERGAVEGALQRAGLAAETR